MNKKEISRSKRHARIKLKIFGTTERPRLVVCRSLGNFSVLLVDDVNNKTLMSVSSSQKDFKSKFPSGGNIKSAVGLAEVCAKRLKEKGINEIVFDRAGYLYHGRVKAFADGLRKGGLKF